VVAIDLDTGAWDMISGTVADAQAKQLKGRGLFAGIVNTEEHLREKREDAAREDRDL
jgi:hypothetical protein